MESRVSLCVYFEDPFWIAIIERQSGGALEVARVVFGAEPNNAQVYAWLISDWERLRFSSAIKASWRAMPGNPKRRQRAAARAVQQRGGSTKSQEALARQREQQKAEAANKSRVRKKAKADEVWTAKQHKRKEKHRGH